MTIHPSHPFLPAEPERDPIRRLRGRLVTPVTLWANGQGGSRAGLTVSSTTIAEGSPPLVLGLVDPEADLFERLEGTGTFVVSLLQWPDHQLAEVFAGLAPAPGGAFGTATWTETAWGPALAQRSWIGCRLVEHRTVGYGELVSGEIESVELLAAGAGRAGDAAHAASALGRIRGRYVAVPSPTRPD